MMCPKRVARMGSKLSVSTKMSWMSYRHGDTTSPTFRMPSSVAVNWLPSLIIHICLLPVDITDTTGRYASCHKLRYMDWHLPLFHGPFVARDRK